MLKPFLNSSFLSQNLVGLIFLKVKRSIHAYNWVEISAISLRFAFAETYIEPNRISTMGLFFRKYLITFSR